MKHRLFALLATAVFACSCQAAILIYKGSMVEKRVGGSTESRHEYRALVMIDMTSGVTRRIDYFPGSSGFYMVRPEYQFVTNRIVLKDGRSQTVLANADSGGSGTPVAATFVKGLNTRLQVENNGHLTAPGALDWSFRSAGQVNAGPASTVDETGIFAYHEGFTMAVNNRDENLEQALQRMRAVLESAGYREVEFR